jgi:hypothetical protein
MIFEDDVEALAAALTSHVGRDTDRSGSDPGVSDRNGDQGVQEESMGSAVPRRGQ